jgi:hypothetical protein
MLKLNHFIKNFYPIKLFGYMSKKYSTNNSSDSKLGVVFHAFSKEEAAKKFVDYDSKRIFAPKVKHSTQPEIIIESDPLKKVLLPCFGANATIKETYYEGQYGIRRERTTFTTDDKGEIVSKTEVYTEWYNTTGWLESISYTDRDEGLRIYAGYTYPSHTIEDAMNGWNVNANLVPYDPNQIKIDTVVDPFLKRKAVGDEEITSKIKSYEINRAERDIRRSTGHSTVQVDRINITFASFKTLSYLLPAYVLKYTNTPPRIMSALTQKTTVVGAAPISISKSMLASFGVTVILSFFAPQISIAMNIPRISFIAQIIAPLISSVITGAWAKHRLSIKETWQQSRIEKKKRHNEGVSETDSDHKRRLFTENKNEEDIKFQKDVKFQQVEYTKQEIQALQTLGIELKPKEELTKKRITQSAHKILKKIHPDKIPDENISEKEHATKSTQQVNAAKTTLLNKLTKRKYSTFSCKKTIIKEPPRSTNHPRAHELITAVLEEKDYKKALKLVKEDEIHPDAHDNNENTLITEAAKRGDLKAIAFAIDELGSSPDASCDCPVHMTALHYSSINGNYEAINLLLKKKANPNLINSYGQTPLDVAVKEGHKEVATLLENYGGIRNTHRNPFKSFFGLYKSEERTVLLEESTTSLEEDSEIIHLPPPEKKK